MSERKWDYDGAFLEQFPQNYRGVVVNVFCEAVRDGYRTLDGLVQEARARASAKVDCPAPWEREESLDAMTILKRALGDGEGRDLAAHVLWRESLPYAERQRLKKESKRENGVEYAKWRMAKLDPTDKQLLYLKRLGCNTVPKTRLEAHDLIDQYVNGNVQRQTA